MIERIDPSRVYPENKLYLDYIAGAASTVSLFSHSPEQFAQALAQRRAVDYPRAAISDLLREYNAGIGASHACLAKIASLSGRSTFCVISGQQVGFLGGPVYTTYKIVTTIRLAASLEERLGVKVVPMFWLADEDHDFAEINHAYVAKGDGEVGKISFDWEGRGRQIADLPISNEVRSAYTSYLEALPACAYNARIEEILAPKPGENYTTWHARLFAQIFSRWGLIIVTSTILRAPGRAFFRTALERSTAIRAALDEGAATVRAAGYSPALPAERAGMLYVIDDDGRRVRVTDSLPHLPLVDKYPERYSADVALRPLLADTLLPVIASVLGPGEIAYHAMLKPLYRLFSLPQPIAFPRESLTVITRAEADLITRFKTSASALLSGEFSSEEAKRALAPSDLKKGFADARDAITAGLAPLSPLVEALDPSLIRSCEGTRVAALRALAQLEDRTLRANLAKHGLSLGALQQLRNTLLPRGRLQERVFPLPHFINRHGTTFVERLVALAELDNSHHRVLTWEDDD